VSIEVRPATPDRWGDLVTVFGRRGDDPSWCWCRLFLRSTRCELPEPDAPPDNREALRQEIAEAAVPPGLLAYVDDVPVGWTRVGPRSAFPRVNENTALARVLAEDAGVWWVTCFAVDSRHRRTGVGSRLLAAAVEFARDHGAIAVEGHPVDVAGLRAAPVGGAAIFTGTVAMFAAAGFTEVARTYPTRPVMRLVV
jgi:GNAT superfamily N-acetyltransferase